MIKNIDLNKDCMINIMDNRLVKVYGKMIQKKKSRGKMYYMKDKTLAYV